VDLVRHLLQALRPLGAAGGPVISEATAPDRRPPDDDPFPRRRPLGVPGAEAEGGEKGGPRWAAAGRPAPRLPTQIMAPRRPSRARR
jgi:hypothetical protein